MLGLTWPEFWDGQPAVILDALMGAAERIQTIDTAMRLGLPELAESTSVQFARTKYLKTYWEIRRRFDPVKAEGN